MKKIALVMDEWKRCFTYAWPSGISQRVHECGEDVNLYIFSSSGNWSRDEKYNNGEYNIYRLPDFREFDGIILDLNNIILKDVRENVIQWAKESGVPVISVGREIEGCYYVGTDNYDAMYKIIDHMYEVHDSRTFWFVMGPLDNYENEKRVNALKDYMVEKKLSYTDQDFYYGNFEYECGEEGFEALYHMHHSLPDAIICANDNIAVGVAEAALKYGFRVPTDFKITGFDNFDKASIYQPNISTVGYIREEVGIYCVDLFRKIWNGEAADKWNFIKTEAVYWESCGCQKQAKIDVRKRLKDRMLYDIETQQFENTVSMLEYELQYCDTIPDIMNCIARFVSSFKCDAMYLVMDERIHAYKKQVKIDETYDIGEVEGFWSKGYPPRMQMQFAYENGARLTELESSHVSGIFPRFDYQNPGQDFLFLPLHFGQDAVGYFVIRNAVYLLQQQYLYDVMGVLTKAIENLHKKEKLQYMNDLLSKLYTNDALTGLYNRMGYMKYGAEYILKMHQEGKSVTVFFIDLDKLKEINDRFGHENGDFAIISVARAIEKCSLSDSIISRIGGDEYVLLQQTMDIQQEDEMKKNIRLELENCVKEKKFQMPITVSIGSVTTDPKNNYTLEEYVKFADEKMYKEKAAKKVNRK